MKGVVLHGGAGTRLRPLTFTGPKQLIPVANKPVSQYVVEDLVSANIKDIAIILGNTYPELVREHYGDGSRFNANITYIEQGKPLGIAHAVSLAKDFVNDDRFVVYLGDNLLQYGIKDHLKKFLDEDLDAMVLLKEVDNPSQFGIAVIEDGKIIRVVEKPKEPISNYALVGVYFLKPMIFDVIKDLKPSWRNELEITDAIQLMIEYGYNVGYDIVRGWWFDTGKKDDILYVNALILDERIRYDIRGELTDSNIVGRVKIEDNASIINSEIRGPVIIGRGCIIKGSYIGPYTAIGSNCKIINSSIEYSIVLDNAMINNIERMEKCLIGRNAKVMRNTKKALKLNVGDYSEIEI